jgi:hypothetical protein
MSEGKATKVVSYDELKEVLKHRLELEFNEYMSFVDSVFKDFVEYQKALAEETKVKPQPVKTEPEKIPMVTEAQKRYITFLCGKYNESLPDFSRLTKEDASKLIDKLLEKGKRK